ncbi:hypothetical protein HDV57DRAFT_505445 [Trichoderma longibrachiatum]
MTPAGLWLLRSACMRHQPGAAGDVSPLPSPAGAFLLLLPSNSSFILISLLLLLKLLLISVFKLCSSPLRKFPPIDQLVLGVGGRVQSAATSTHHVKTRTTQAQYIQSVQRFEPFSKATNRTDIRLHSSTMRAARVRFIAGLLCCNSRIRTTWLTVITVLHSYRAARLSALVTRGVLKATAFPMLALLPQGAR